MKVDLQYILKNDHFRICNLLTTDKFITFCTERKIRITSKVLERFEELGIFYPIARAIQWPYVEKIRTSNEHDGYERLGLLDESEVWDGETRTEYSSFYFGQPDTEQWIKEGFLWNPTTKPFVKWDIYKSDEDIRRMTSYYSPFQAYELFHKIQLLRRNIAAEFWILEPNEWAESVNKWATEQLENSKKQYFRYDISLLCQIISNRYYPHTQTNRRYYSLNPPYNWNWYDFCDKWDSNKTLKELSLKTDNIRKAWEMLVMDAKSCDPMEKWYNLISFTAIEKRRELKGSALRAQTWYALEHMLRLFYFDLTKEELPIPEGPITYKFIPGYEKLIPSNPIDQLEQLTNDFHLNPRPSLILIVEGKTEATVLPLAIERISGLTTQTIGIQIISLEGIGNFDGSKKYDRYGALIHFIDDYHSHGTIVFVLLDNEGRSQKTRSRLLKAQSLYGNRKVTREDYIKLWDKNIELDNFSDKEIAEAMSSISENGIEFIAHQIEEVRRSFGKKHYKKLEQVYSERNQGALNKPLLMDSLVKLINIKDLKTGDNVQRPFIAVLRKIINHAKENFPQSPQWHREYLAIKGLYGELLTDSTQDSRKDAK